MEGKRRVVVGISGASGTPLALHLLRVLADMPDIEVHLVTTSGAKLTAEYESPVPFSDIVALADVYHENDGIGDSIASGTFKTAGMVIVPCSMKTVAGIASGYSDNLLLRAADVCVKEKRPLVLACRETPLSPIHLRNLESLSLLPNVYIVPPMLTYYIQPKSIEEMEHHIVAKLLGPLGIEVPGFRRWGEEQD